MKMDTISHWNIVITL